MGIAYLLLQLTQTSNTAHRISKNCYSKWDKQDPELQTKLPTHFRFLKHLQMSTWWKWPTQQQLQVLKGHHLFSQGEGQCILMKMETLLMSFMKKCCLNEKEGKEK